MVKRIKYLFIIFAFFLTGCSTVYEVEIKDDLSIIESAKIYGDTDLYDIYNKTSKNNVMKALLEPYEEVLKEKNYSYELREESNPNIYVEKQYSDIKQFIDNSILFNDYFDEIKYEKSGNIIKVETIGFNPVGADDTDRFINSSLEIWITSNYKILSSNAKTINSKTNAMFFELDNKTDDFKIQFEIDTSKKFNPWINTYIAIGIAVIVVASLWIMSAYTKKKNSK